MTFIVINRRFFLSITLIKIIYNFYVKESLYMHVKKIN